MEKGRIGLLATRFVQVIAAAVVLGVSAKLYEDLHDAEEECKVWFHDKYCNFGRLPSSLGYASFTGAFGLLDAVVGVVAACVTAVPWVVVLVFDALAAVFFLVGGINSTLLRSKQAAGFDGSAGTRFNTSTAFMFIGFLAALGAMAMVFFSRRSSNKHSAV